MSDLPTAPVKSSPISLAGQWRNLMPIAVAAVVSAIVLFWLVGNPLFAAAFFSAALLLGGFALAMRFLYPPVDAEQPLPDWSIARALAEHSDEAVAVTDRAGRLVCANDHYQRYFGSFLPPTELMQSGEAPGALVEAARTAWRDGKGGKDVLSSSAGTVKVDVVRAGLAEDHLVWRFEKLVEPDRYRDMLSLLTGEAGDWLGKSGVMAAMLDKDGLIQASNRVFALRATGDLVGKVNGRGLVDFLVSHPNNGIRFASEGRQGPPLRFILLPVDEGVDDGPMFMLMIDDDLAAGGMVMTGAGVEGHIGTILSLLPQSLALVDRDGRMLFLNQAFRRFIDIDEDAKIAWPGDLVVREDKAALADHIRRFSSGRALSGDIAVRFMNAPDDPVTLSVTSVRGLGAAAVLIMIRDSSEESRLKREVIQANKMQAIGQLAGGVAHDFNNILTAIIGYCDLMLMRHAPGDSDFDDIQHIRTNSNRAAALTRQLLAFSRQQTLVPQTLQLPDVVSDVSNMLKRLLGESITLTVNHGRNLGSVRADPGQLGQVIVNLAVNARDAMLSANPAGGGELTIETYATSARDVRDIGAEILPIANYTTLRITDTGPGIPPEILPKIFEPFFTTKEVGKGTGLGLSTVYGIVKQSGGFIFAGRSEKGGAQFTLYLPVHQPTPGEEDATAKPEVAKPDRSEFWGQGKILIVEDEDMVRAVAERALTRQGYTVRMAANGEEALKMLAEDGDVDLIVSDVVMPGMDGPAMAKALRRTHPEMPILFMSGYAEEQLRRSIDLEKIAFLPKPFSVIQLAEAVGRVLGSKQPD